MSSFIAGLFPIVSIDLFLVGVSAGVAPAAGNYVVPARAHRAPLMNMRFVPFTVIRVVGRILRLAFLLVAPLVVG